MKKIFKPEKNFFSLPKGKKSLPLDNSNDIYFNLSNAARNWRAAFLGILLLFSFSLFGIIKISSQSSITPFIVEINKETGIIKKLGVLSEIRYTPNDKITFSLLRQFLLNTRTIPLDLVQYGKNIEESYYSLDNVSQQKLLTYIEKDNIKERVKSKESRDIEISSITKMSSNIFQIRWTETNYSENGTIDFKEIFSGLFTVKFEEKTTESEILRNPLGFTITDFNYSREI